MVEPPPPSRQTPNPPPQSNKSPPLCPSHASNPGPNCTLTPHPVLANTRYCTTHQALCPSCASQPAHPIGRQCKSCVWRRKAEKRAKRAAAVAARGVEREMALEAAEKRREEVREAGRGWVGKREAMGMETRTEVVLKERKKRGRNKRGGRRRKE